MFPPKNLARKGLIQAQAWTTDSTNRLYALAKWNPLGNRHMQNFTRFKISRTYAWK